MEERNTRRSIQGVVVSNNNAKTIGVLVETHKNIQNMENALNIERSITRMMKTTKLKLATSLPSWKQENYLLQRDSD